MAGWLGVTFAHARSKESGACHRAERELVLGAPVVGFEASHPCSSAGVAARGSHMLSYTAPPELFASVSSVSLSHIERLLPIWHLLLLLLLTHTRIDANVKMKERKKYNGEW